MSIESVAQYMEEESEEKVMDVAEETQVEEGTEMKEEKTSVAVTVMVTDPEKGTGGNGGGGNGGGGGSGALMSKKEKWWCKVLLGMRISALILCLKAFAVLAADNQNVVVPRSVHLYYVMVVEAFRWKDYNEFKYIVAVNVIGFLYSGLQISELVKYLITKKHTVNPRIRGYFSVIMDQGLAYLLMSASSSAASTIHIYRSYWTGEGAHTFTDMASAAVALSFLAFLAFASASIVSGLILCRFSGRPE
ncbi:CASP-like protein N24 [Lotus japonicus]|uniref:CASP-like protein N24 n=1 Tax=Lotus japonicus TaxID=34305 RepID=UPI00258C7728|nr:CASP-like protein N24 [Lotus japonicus]